MDRTNNTKTRKHIPALAAALTMTALIAAAMLAFGVNALLNQNVTPSAQAAGLDSTGTAPDQALSDRALIDQLQAQVSAYQARESQYQAELKDAAGQIDQLTQQDQQYRSLISALQNAGVIRITQDGRVLISNTAASSFEHERDDD